MSFKHDAVDCLEDIIENAECVSDYLSGLDREAFEASRVTRDAVERCIERVCEAVFRLGDRAEALLPTMPAADIRGMGNWLRHAYERVDADIIWDTAVVRLPELRHAAEAALIAAKKGAEDKAGATGKEQQP